VAFAPPVPLDDLYGREQTADVLKEATDRLMEAIGATLESVRGEPRPRPRPDPRQ
jgi:hypothetical protein